MTARIPYCLWAPINIFICVFGCTHANDGRAARIVDNHNVSEYILYSKPKEAYKFLILPPSFFLALETRTLALVDGCWTGTMSRGHSAKSSRVERTRFIPSSAANAPLLRLRTGEITTEGRTQLHTCYVPAPSLHVFDSLDTGSDAGPFCGGDWDEFPLEQGGSQQMLCEPSSDRRKRTAAVSTVAYDCYSDWLIMP